MRQYPEQTEPEPQAAMLKGKAREAVLEFLKSELEIAETFVSVAETTANRETAVRTVTNACLALKTALNLAGQLHLDSAERRAFQDSYGALYLRLEDLRVQWRE